MNEQLSQIELYHKLKKLKPLFEQFAETREVRIKDADVALMQEVYATVNVLARGNMPLNFNAGCASCIEEAFHVFISVFNRLEADPHVTEQNPPTDGVGKSDGIIVGGNYDARRKQLEAIGFVFNEDEKGFESADSWVDEKDLHDLSDDEFNSVMETAKALHTAASNTFTEDEENSLKDKLGLNDEDDVVEYSTRLDDYIGGLVDPIDAKLLIKQSELKKAVAALPPAKKANETVAEKTKDVAHKAKK